MLKYIFIVIVIVTVIVIVIVTVIVIVIVVVVVVVVIVVVVIIIIIIIIIIITISTTLDFPSPNVLNNRFFSIGFLLASDLCRLQSVPIFPLEFVEPRKDIANARNLGNARKNKRSFSCFSSPRFPRAGARDVFPRLDELKRKNRD